MQQPALSADDEFNVQWQDPDEANVCWVWNPNHFPYPFPPLAMDCGRLGSDAIDGAMGVPEEERPGMRFINGFWYWNQVGEGQPSVERRKQIIEESKDPWGTWKDVWEPEIQSLLDPIKANDLGSVPYAEITDALGRLFADSSRAWGVTMAAAQVMDAVALPFLKYCKTELGDEGVLLGVTMLSRYSNYSTKSDAVIWDLVKLIRDTPDPEQTITALERNTDSIDTESGKFANQFLNHYGWRSPVWSDMTSPVWRINPSPFFELLRHYIDKLPEDPRVATRRAAQRRRRLVTSVRSGLSGKNRDHFDELEKTASIDVRLREARAFWQIAALGVLGVPCRAAGARLVEAGVIDAVDDIYHLHLDDIREATTVSGGDKWPRLIAERKSAYAMD